MLGSRRRFHGRLDAIVHDLVVLAAHVAESIPRGTEALLAGDVATAQAIIDHDDVVDRLAAEIEERCIVSMALQQPVADDLRALVAAIRLVSEIERSGDLMVNVAKGYCRIHPVVLPPTVRGYIQELGEHATQLFRASMDAYAEGDADLAAQLAGLDDRLDAIHASYIAEVLAWGGGGDVGTAVQLALIGRYYERIGDHAVNIGERVRFMVEGWSALDVPVAGPASDPSMGEVRS